MFCLCLCVEFSSSWLCLSALHVHWFWYQNLDVCDRQLFASSPCRRAELEDAVPFPF
eukprot:m.250801 g.250801  ORF g.250801 m.250801 type:complete len:57 (+) comp19531_c0_seq7:1049-1219(+)